MAKPLKGSRLLLLLALVFPIVAFAQNPACSNKPPKEIIEKLWSSATRGDLLQQKGWEKLSAGFSTRLPWSSQRPLRVFSNFFGVNSVQASGSSTVVDVQMESTLLGELDTDLRFQPAPPPPQFVSRTSIHYRLVSAPAYLYKYGLDGKTLVEEIPIPGCSTWRIEGSLSWPFTTVNTAIRYVLEASRKTKDPAIKKNAQATINQLLLLD